MGRLAGVWLVSLLLAVAAAVGEPESTEVLSTYIVHVAPGHAPQSSRPRLLSRAYTSFLRDQLPTHLQQPEPRLHYTYAHAATGFAAGLTRRQAEHLTSLPSVLAVVRDRLRQPHTTLTPSFLGLGSTPAGGLLPSSNGASDVVIGVIDSGIYPKDRASFAADPSMTAPPTKFRGSCVSGPSFNASAYCNNKLVGAKFFFKGYEAEEGPIPEALKSPIDTTGHGTHTASTAAGSAVTEASLFNYAKGKAVGMAPGARIAAYKVLWENGCVDSDVIAAFEEAIKDGVGVISFSIGPDEVVPELYEDGNAVAAFNAVRKGIVVSASAGNEGPGESTVKNTAPWFITVGASTINRRFMATVVLGNGKSFTGASLYDGAPLGGEAKIPLVFSADVGSEYCEAGKLNASLVSGKIVVCQVHWPWLHGAQGEAVRLAGGVGAIFITPEAEGELMTPVAHILPASSVTFAAGGKILRYISTQQSPVATIVFNGTIVGRTPSSPRMATFSSRGPNPQLPEIFKPDITAPGVGILAAWTGESPPSGIANDTRRAQFNIMSGTSMACPHVSGIAAMLRQARPKWSPAAIKSALMTTAYNVGNAGDIIKDMSTGKASTPFVRGAGHVDPNRALDPGLVYDAGADDYVSFLCALGYTSKQIAIFTRDGSETDCSKRKGSSAGDFNYPAFSVVFNSDKKAIQQRRFVRDVRKEFIDGYKVLVTSPAGVRVTVTPEVLVFTALDRTHKYDVTFTPLKEVNVTEKHTFGSIVWSDGKHKVTSPIAITWPVKEQGQVAAM